MEVGHTASTALVLAREEFVTCFEEALPLLQKHWQEITAFHDIPLNPNVDRYIEFDDNGQLRIYTARIDGALVGYAVFFLAFNTHYRDSLQAVQDIVYVDPDKRQSTVGLRLLRFADAMLREEGVQLISHHVKLAHPALGVILERMGYVPIETIYAKRMDL